MTVKIDDDAAINNVIFTDQGSAPTTPGAGKTRVFTKSDGLYIIDDDAAVIGPFITGTSVSAFVGARYNTDAAQNIVNGAAIAIINFDDRVYDTGDFVTTGTAWKFTVPTTGYYHIDAMVQFTSTSDWAAGERGNLVLYKGGAAFIGLDRKDNYSGTTVFMYLQGHVTVYLEATNYIDIRVAQNSGADLALSNDPLTVWVNIEKIG